MFRTLPGLNHLLLLPDLDVIGHVFIYVYKQPCRAALVSTGARLRAGFQYYRGKNKVSLPHIEGFRFYNCVGERRRKPNHGALRTPRQIGNPVVMETHREGGGSRPRSSGLPRVKKGTAGRDRSALPDAKRTPRERRRKRVRRGETESQTPEKRRREASTRNPREERGKKGRKSHPERRRRTRQPATAQEGRGWTRYVP
ncbi:hypothetical protein NDU88_003010 [Pleurodeles waltl]|uniref:Uncharacterized protein n=1 Tax=Pleurodeles waltl TaxID=8319 RepID=A0AAV7VGA0_PLEWA|nr:hypothetical protein NDU88_003010 [Pleurodeles waltl]